MKKLLILLLAICFLAPAAIAKEKAVVQEYPIAIVVAIEFYSSGWAWRPDAIKDANQVAWILETSGFKVKRLYGTQADKKSIFDSLEWATREAGDKGQVLVYFSGHGMRIESDPEGAYVAPYGASPGVDADLIKVDELKKEVTDYVYPENTLFIIDTGSTYEQPDKQLGTIQELATTLKKGLSTGSADGNNNGRVEFNELANQIGPKVKEVKIHARPADEVYITEDEVVVITNKPRKKRRARKSAEPYRMDQFDQLLEKRMEEKIMKMDKIEQKMEEIDQLMSDPRRLPLPF